MIKAKEFAPYGFDYELENGDLLHHTEWNGEVYETDRAVYRPVYEHDEEADQYFTIGFEVLYEKG